MMYCSQRFLKKWLRGPVLILVFSCTSDDLSSIESEELLVTDHTALFEDIEGSACCVIGAEEVAPGTLETYNFTTNIEAAEISWKVVSGAMELVEGNNGDSVILKFSPDFTEGTLEGMGMNHLVGCGQRLIISKK